MSNILRSRRQRRLTVAVQARTPSRSMATISIRTRNQMTISRENASQPK